MNETDKATYIVDIKSTQLGFYSYIIGWTVLAISLFLPVSDATRSAISQAVIASNVGSGIIAYSNKYKQDKSVK